MGVIGGPRGGLQEDGDGCQCDARLVDMGRYRREDLDVIPLFSFNRYILF